MIDFRMQRLPVSAVYTIAPRSHEFELRLIEPNGTGRIWLHGAVCLAGYFGGDLPSILLAPSSKPIQIFLSCCRIQADD